MMPPGRCRKVHQQPSQSRIRLRHFGWPLSIGRRGPESSRGRLVDCDAHCRVPAGETPALSCRPLDRSAWWRVGVVQDLGERQRALAALSRLQVVRVVQAFVGKVDQVDASLPPF
jgi:hypothetical protein